MTKDVIVKITEVHYTWANCECCWYYDSRCFDLECWHQEILWYEEMEVWQEIRCRECSWDFDEAFNPINENE